MNRIESLVQGARLQLVRGKLAFQAERYQEAAAAFTAAVQANPENAAAWVNLGTVLVQRGRGGAAITHFREALRFDPDNVTAHYNLGALLVSSGDFEQAVSHLRTSIVEIPRDAQAHYYLGTALDKLGREDEALIHYAIANDYSPNNETLVGRIAELLGRQGRFGAARERLEAAHARFPAAGRTAHTLARFLATSPDPAFRDGQRALALAQKVYKAKKSPHYVETIALALAELDRCEEASDWQRQLVEQAEKEGDAILARRLQETLTRYEQGSPCRAPVMQTATTQPGAEQPQPSAGSTQTPTQSSDEQAGSSAEPQAAAPPA